MQVKQITPINWIVTSSLTGKKLGLVTQKEQGYSLITEPSKFFKDFDELASMFGESVTESNDEVIEQAVSEINGYPVKHLNAFEITIDEEANLNTYKAKEGGKLTFVAGYFGVKFKNGYVGSFCPKISTLLGSDFIGPYKDKFDLQFQILKYNREK